MRSNRLLLILLAAGIGVAVGIGAFTFIYAKGSSYLTNDPAACANCHIMSEHYAAWTKSSHHTVAVCNDCHTPHGSVVAKYMTKASNGFWHSLGFTTGRFPDPLTIKQGNREVTEGACRSCHEDIVESIDHAAHAGSGHANTLRADEQISCIRCHSNVGHWVR